MSGHIRREGRQRVPLRCAPRKVRPRMVWAGTRVFCHPELWAPAICSGGGPEGTSPRPGTPVTVSSTAHQPRSHTPWEGAEKTTEEWADPARREGSGHHIFVSHSYPRCHAQSKARTASIHLCRPSGVSERNRGF